MSGLFDPLTLRGVTLPNRIAVSPMCQYSSEGGFANDWHFIHLGSRAVGGAGLVFVEATAVSPDGRISPEDMGLWQDPHIDQLARISRFVREQGAHLGIQLAHAGRKASTRRPWDGTGTISAAQGGWVPVAPSAIPFAEADPPPHALTLAEIAGILADFAAAAQRALAAGFSVLEVHSAHGYLFHEFLSSLTNRRTDQYGGSFENRTRLVCEAVAAVRAVWPEHLPLFVRLSTTDWHAGGWTLEDSIDLVRRLGPLGVDLVDCSSGGAVPHVRIPVGPGYQAAFAERIRRETGIPTGAVGAITEPVQADHIIRSGQADLVLLARELLRDPYWPLRAARELGQAASWPAQYLRSAPPGAPARSAVAPV